jgi:hypothetical protein
MKIKVTYGVLLFTVLVSLGCATMSAEQAATLTQFKSGKESFTQTELRAAFEKQWPEVQKSYPAVAIVFMLQEGALASAVSRDVSLNKALGNYVKVSTTPVAVAIAEGWRVAGCLDALVFCDNLAAQDGEYTVDEHRGCSQDFTNCMTAHSD